VQGTLGAEFHKELDVSNPDLIVQKGQNKLVDSFSAFGNPELNTFLQSKGVGTVYVCGLCYDFCVGSTAVDAAKHGLSTYVLLNASRAVSVPTTTVMEGLFSKHLVKVINSSEIKQ
jgi:nicotinamidase/pyrazinamidase